MHNAGRSNEMSDGKIAKGTPLGSNGEVIDVNSLEYRLAKPLRNKRQWSTFTRLMGVFMIISGIFGLLKPAIYFLESAFKDDLNEPHLYDHALGEKELPVIFSIMVV